MPKCRICDHNNPAGIDRCENCGSWIEQAVPSASTGQEPRTGSVDQQPNDLEGQILSLMRQNQKIAAVKLYREQTGCGLKEAKDAVEALAAGGQTLERRNPGADGIKPDSLESHVLALMQGQKKIEAIMVYREHTGVGLKQAKDAVEALAVKHGISPKGAGCAGMVLLMAVVSTIIGISLWVLPA